MGKLAVCRWSALRKQFCNFGLCTALGSRAAEDGKCLVVIGLGLASGPVQQSQIIQGSLVRRSDPQRVVEQFLALQISTLQKVRIAHVAKQVGIIRVFPQCREIMLFSRPKVLLFVGENGKSMMCDEMIRFFLQHPLIGLLRLFQSPLGGLGMSPIQVDRNRFEAGKTPGLAVLAGTAGQLLIPCR